MEKTKIIKIILVSLVCIYILWVLPEKITLPYEELKILMISIVLFGLFLWYIAVNVPAQKLRKPLDEEEEEK